MVPDPTPAIQQPPKAGPGAEAVGVALGHAVVAATPRLLRCRQLTVPGASPGAPCPVKTMSGPARSTRLPLIRYPATAAGQDGKQRAYPGGLGPVRPEQRRRLLTTAPSSAERQANEAGQGCCRQSASPQRAGRDALVASAPVAAAIGCTGASAAWRQASPAAMVGLTDIRPACVVWRHHVHVDHCAVHADEQSRRRVGLAGANGRAGGGVGAGQAVAAEVPAAICAQGEAGAAAAERAEAEGADHVPPLLWSARVPKGQHRWLRKRGCDEAAAPPSTQSQHAARRAGWEKEERAALLTSAPLQPWGWRRGRGGLRRRRAAGRGPRRQLQLKQL